MLSPETKGPVEVTRTLAPIRLLLVEHDEEFARLLEQPIGDWHAAELTLAHAGSLDNALELLDTEKPDAILLDLVLPDSGGIDTLAAIRKQAPDLPVIVLGLPDDEIALKALQQGAQDYIVKGRVDGDSLLRAVRYAIERKKVERRLLDSEARHRRLMEEASDAIFVTDFQGRFLDVNPKTCQMSGYTREELLGMNIRDLVVPEEYATVPPRFELLQAGQNVLSERIVRCKDGSLRLMEVNAGMIDEGRIEGIARDVTERKALEERNRRLAEELEQKVAERTAQLKAANRDLQLEVEERKAVEDTLNTRARQQAAVATLGLHALLGGNVSELLDETVAMVAHTLDVEYCKVLELLPGGQEMLVVAGVGWEEGVVGSARVSAEPLSQVGYVLASDRPVIVDDLTSDRRFEGTPLLHEHGVRSGMSVIIHGKGGPYGVLGAHTASRRIFTEDDVHFLESAANVLAIAIDRKRTEDALRESEGRFRMLADTAPVMIWMSGPDALCTFFNKTWLDFTGRTQQQEIGNGWMEDIHPADLRYCVDSYLGAFQRRESYRAEYRMKRTDGEYRWVLDTGVPRLTPGGVLEGFIGSCIDITERKLSEDEIRQLNSSLQAANRELEAFSYSVSHDLRAPLRAINGYSTALEEEQADRLDKEGVYYLERIKTNARRMSELIDDLLSFSRLARQQIAWADIDMDELARDIIGELEVISGGQKIQLEVKGAPHSRGDRAMVRLMLQNLLHNAVKFSQQREVSVVQFGGAAGGGSEQQNTYYVKDNGVGFDMRYADKLFGVFQRLHAAGEFEGTGVGLALVQRIVHRHGGRVWAEGTPDEGAIFYFTLPARD